MFLRHGTLVRSRLFRARSACQIWTAACVGAVGANTCKRHRAQSTIAVEENIRNTSRFTFGKSQADKLAVVHEAEGKILSLMQDTPYEAINVPVPLDAGRRCFLETPKTQYTIRTVIVGKEHTTKPPIVLVHGYMMGAPAFFKVLPLLAQDRTVYAIDVIGMGGSERPPFNARDMTPEEAEALLVEPFERWAEAMNLSEFILLGHSFGGFVSGAWAARYPGRIKCLGLLSPLLGWSDERISKIKESIGDSLMACVIDAAWAHHITPHSLVRKVPGFKRLLARSNERRFQGMATNVSKDEGRMMSEYVVASMDMPSSTEHAATVCFQKWLAAVEVEGGTIKQRLSRLDVPMFAIYGDRDWMEAASPAELPNCTFVRLENSGHHLYFDNPAGLARDVLAHVRHL
eukprot:TRINITY_DN60977_c0_g1_i1.p1 TRINITY_DN60977_c0_g1~~TRINITY_DN60977_c0_g1_i1.p1  ORF type:complete len:402 (-),score=62.85 TRINITY_DN60977_c0_g1_i1:151-1356(-)